MTNHQTNSLNKRETKQLQNTSFWEYSDLFLRAVCDLTEKNLTHVYSRLTIHSTETHVPAPSVRHYACAEPYHPTSGSHGQLFSPLLGLISLA